MNEFYLAWCNKRLLLFFFFFVLFLAKQTMFVGLMSQCLFVAVVRLGGDAMPHRLLIPGDIHFDKQPKPEW